MLVLALDTALSSLSVALLDAGQDRLLAAAREQRERGQAERLMPMLREVAQAAGRRLAEIDRIVVTTGPGSFTGVRVGLAAARGLALARGCPLLGVTTFEAVAAGVAAAAGHGAEAGTLLITFAAGRGAFYGEAWRMGRPLGEARLGPPVSLAEAWQACEPPVILAGSGAPALAPALAARGLAATPLAGFEAPDAAAFVRLAAARPAPAFVPRPLYLREADAIPSRHLPESGGLGQGLP